MAKQEIILTVRKDELIKFYFSNWSRNEASMFVDDVATAVINEGSYSLSAEEIADQIGYVPANIVEGEHKVDEFEVWDKIILI